MAVEVCFDETIVDIHSVILLTTLIRKSDTGRTQERSSALVGGRTRSVLVLILRVPKYLQQQRVLHESEVVARIEPTRSEDCLEIVRSVLPERLLFRAPGRIAQAAYRHFAEKVKNI